MEKASGRKERKERKGKERKGKERKGKDRKRQERKGKERKGRSRWEMFARGTNDVEMGLPYACLELVEGPWLLLTNGVQSQGCAPGAVSKNLLLPGQRDV